MKKLLAALSALFLSCNMVCMSTTFAEAKVSGDVNADGIVSVSDIVLLQKWLLAVPNAKLTNWKAADVYEDDVIDIFDLAMLKRKLTVSSEKSNAPIAALHPSLPSTGTDRILVAAVDFPDHPFELEKIVSQLEELCFGPENTSDAKYPNESVSAYFERSSNGKLHLQSDVFWYTAQHPIEWYNDENPRLLAEEIMTALDADVDYQVYDADSNHILDSMVIAIPESVLDVDQDQNGIPDWWYFSIPYNGSDKCDDVTLGTYCVVPFTMQDRTGFVNKLAHELCHAMELPDYYKYAQDDDSDTDGMTGSAGYELMDEGSGDLSAFSKLMLGWLDENVIQVYSGGTQTFSLTSMQQKPSCIMIPRYSDSGYLSEYFLIEYETGEGNNAAYFTHEMPNQLFQRSGGVRILHCQAETYDSAFGTKFKYDLNSPYYDKSNAKQRVLRLVNDVNFYVRTVIDGNTAGFHWYDADGALTVDTGLTIRISDVRPGPDYEEDSFSASSGMGSRNDPAFLNGSSYSIIIEQN